jgi:hypothetical protein
MGWTMLYLFVALKVPILLAGGLIWWAVRQEPPLDDERDDGGSHDRPHPVPRLPRAPRRGPHGDPPPAAPARVRPGGRGARTRPREHQR